ncbi:SUMF1/EgtB/PvdO family nonheme iron enzyme [Actinokineospora enzanensis]|uniref:SUMF1/EgtB/PvdO family nonheme iron enzyme n=1 Tax=Actinokineospora enzanensis TaxID=155975 RepID=UPI0003A388B5|nr:SUMF1/EgtB/PvdO family nonheme iron enzyme [Actinokineospora enzanensis]
MGTFRALLVGNARFPLDPVGLGDLRGPHNDVAALHAALSDPSTGLFECLPPLLDAPAQAILSAADDFLATAHRDDCLLFYYSGHGQVDTHNDFYLCGYDTETGNLASPRVAGRLLSRMVDDSPARLKIIVLDCCHAGEFKGGLIAPGHLRGRGRFVLAAARRTSRLLPDAAAADGLSPFTGYLLDALGRPELDVDGDGFITAQDVAEYITDAARHRADRLFALQEWKGSGPVPLARAVARGPVTAGKNGDPTRTTEIPPPPGVLPELVAVPGGFSLSRTLVTNAQFRAFLADPANGRWRRGRDPDYLRTWREVVADPDHEHCPVVDMDQDAAMAYLDWVGERLGRPLRLPRESEWLSAAQAGRDEGWHLADTRAGRVNYRDTLGELGQVGEFGENPTGLADLLGQVWEICVAGHGELVLRGGAFNTPAASLLERRTPARVCRGDVGFRCAADDR